MFRSVTNSDDEQSSRISVADVTICPEILEVIKHMTIISMSENKFANILASEKVGHVSLLEKSGHKIKNVYSLQTGSSIRIATAFEC